MITKLYILKDAIWEELEVYNRVEFDERLDEQLDSGSVQTINTTSEAYADYSLFKLTTQDLDENEKSMQYFGFDTVEKRGDAYHIHTIELVEPTRLIMGFTIDGCKVTQPIEGTKKTLFEVAFSDYGGLTSKAKLLSASDTERYLFNYGGTEIEDMMKDIISPEFHWEAGTLLWECLCDIGNVINCIPRIKFKGSTTNRAYILFEPINNVTGVYEI